MQEGALLAPVLAIATACIVLDKIARSTAYYFCIVDNDTLVASDLPRNSMAVNCRDWDGELVLPKGQTADTSVIL